MAFAAIFFKLSVFSSRIELSSNLKRFAQTSNNFNGTSKPDLSKSLRNSLNISCPKWLS